MDWLEKHAVIRNYLEKTISCKNCERQTQLMKGKPKVISVREISASQLKRIARKGRQLFVVHLEASGKLMKKQKIDELPIITDFKDVFLE